MFNYKYLSDQSRLRSDDFRDLSRDPAGFLEDTLPLRVSLRIAHARPGRYRVRQRVLNTRHGSVYDAWKRVSGKDAADDLQAADAAWLERTCVPDLRIGIVVSAGVIAYDCELEANESRLLEFSLIVE